MDLPEDELPFIDISHFTPCPYGRQLPAVAAVAAWDAQQAHGRRTMSLSVTKLS